MLKKKSHSGKFFCDLDECCLNNEAGHLDLFVHPTRDHIYAIPPTYTQEGCIPLCENDRFCRDYSTHHLQTKQHPQRNSIESGNDKRPICTMDSFCTNSDKCHHMSFQHPGVQVKKREKNNSTREVFPFSPFIIFKHTGVKFDGLQRETRTIGFKILFHGTSPENAYSIERENFHPGPPGRMYGSGIYLTDTPERAFRIGTAAQGKKKALVTVLAKVMMCLVLENTYPDFNKDTLLKLGCDCVRRDASDMYVFYDASSLQILGCQYQDGSRISPVKPTVTYAGCLREVRERRPLELFHATSVEAAVSITRNKSFRPGKTGMFGGAIYLGDSEKRALRISTAAKPVKGTQWAVIKVLADAGRSLVLEVKGMERIPVERAQLEAVGCNAVRNDEHALYAFYDPSLVHVLEYYVRSLE